MRTGPGSGPELSYSRRVALLRKPALTAADKLSVAPEERARIFRELRRARPWPPGQPPSALPGGRSSKQPHLLRVFVYGIDDVRLYKALEGAGLLGRVVLVGSVAAGDAVLASRTKRTGKAVELKEVSNAARNAGKPFIELPALSPVRVAEAVEQLTGWLVPQHLRARPTPPVSFLPPLEQDGASQEALATLTGGLPLHAYIAARAAYHPPEEVLREMDRTDMYDNRERLLSRNPQEREARRAQPLVRPYMERSRITRQRMLAQQRQRQAESSLEEVPW
ncbi:hypothetical protein GPECTOR_1g755 [Gonium pectorale]|uniref:Uncharacterized protein n=1 Tax=Gonium pectorale TaxID=33097 RepID=A0A150H3V5_GONPE|nr:hypothetical protein GPECTOR_1g755 [Gonium pectorale]|eukprot:KXZ56837.1 hypothetical protein GPECTOR_1g755 [Gonium pectorale]